MKQNRIIALCTTTFFLLFTFLFPVGVAAQTLYTDEDNIVKIKVPGIPGSQLIATAEGGTLTRKNTDEWIARPNGEQDFVITVSINKDEKKKVLASKVYNVQTFHFFVEEMPEFIGGLKAMSEFINKEAKYPKGSSASGTALCQFTIRKDGTISDVMIIRSAGDSLLNKEAVRIIKSMPRWKPGKQAGKAVDVRYTVPIKFKKN
jgi:TonB family protein